MHAFQEKAVYVPRQINQIFKLDASARPATHSMHQIRRVDENKLETQYQLRPQALIIIGIGYLLSHTKQLLKLTPTDVIAAAALDIAHQSLRSLFGCILGGQRIPRHGNCQFVHSADHTTLGVRDVRMFLIGKGARGCRERF